jgi:anthranilate/para-aminobenzoate synthase component I
VKLSTLDTCRSFALLGGGFTRDGAPLLLTDLERVGARPALVYAPYEAAAAEARLYRGEPHAALELTFDCAPLTLEPALADSGHTAAVGRIREHIAAGDVYQVNLTLRASLPPVRGSQLVATLCRRGQPRFLAWVRLPEGEELVSASPELLFAVDGGRVRAEPMKGTAPPGGDAALLASEKDRAELAMITDLVRHDLTPVCTPRTVQVEAERRLWRLPYAVQTVSDVAGELLPGCGPLEVLASLHPGGSVTGAPKHAAMSLIRELEDSPRGAYCGSLGLCEEGRAVFSLLIRTASRTPAGWVYGVGGAIVWDSQAAAELEEIRVKLGALR